MSWEVWTMKLKMSFFDWTLLKKNISRFAPAWGLALLVMILALPAGLLHELSKIELSEIWMGTKREFVTEYFKENAAFGPIFSLIAAGIFAALLFHYLHKPRAAYMMHAFPMTRTCLFVTNTVSGLLFWLVPALATGLLTHLVLLANGVSGCGGLLWELLGRWFLQYLCLYGIAVFAMVLAGNTIIALLSCAALNGVFALLPLLTLELVKTYCYGLDVSVAVDSLAYLAPIVAMIGSCKIEFLWIYAAVGLVLLVLAWLHYRRRHIERAGDAMAYGWARVAFRLVFTYTCTLSIGFFLAVFFDGMYHASLDFLFYALIGCVIGWFASSMMVERTVKVFRKRAVWLGFAVWAVLLTGTVLGLRYDVLGSRGRVPEAEQVASVEIWTDNYYLSALNNSRDCVTLTDAADVNTIRTLQQNAIESWENRTDGDGMRITVHICYRLKNGGTLRRVYDWISDEDCKAVAAIYRRPGLAVELYDRILPDRITSAVLENAVVESDEEYGWYITTLDCTQPKALRAAMLADAAAGRLPILNDFTITCWDDFDVQAPDSDDENWDLEEKPGSLTINYLVDPSNNDFRKDGAVWFPEFPVTATETCALFE